MSGDVEPRRGARWDNQLRQKKSNQILKKEIQMSETTTPTPTATTSTMEKRMKRNLNTQAVMIPCVMMSVLMDNLMWSHNDKMTQRMMKVFIVPLATTSSTRRI